MLKPDRPQQLERLLERFAGRLGDLPGVGRRTQPLARAFVAPPRTDVVGAGEVGRDRDAAVLDVEPAGMFALRLHDEVTEEPGRRLQVEGPS